jgi:hypothetical protein
MLNLLTAKYANHTNASVSTAATNADCAAGSPLQGAVIFAAFRGRCPRLLWNCAFSAAARHLQSSIFHLHVKGHSLTVGALFRSTLKRGHQTKILASQLVQRWPINQTRGGSATCDLARHRSQRLIFLAINPGRPPKAFGVALGYIYFTPMEFSVCGHADT